MNLFAYGFDAAGFEIPAERTVRLRFGTVKFIRFGDSSALDRADGVIVPQGIFEEIKRQGERTRVRVHWPELLEREKQLRNIFEKGKWICFLVGEIIDYVPQPWESQEIRDTDLCKRFLNTFSVLREPSRGESFVESQENEFIAYVNEYGLARTVFELPRTTDIESHVLVKAKTRAVGFELFGRIFFLPFHTARMSSEETVSIAKIVSAAVHDYVQKRMVEVPGWVNEFTFRTEEKLEGKLKGLLRQTDECQARLESVRNYKAILTTSGALLKRRVISILEEFFHMKIDPTDENREDAKIIDERGRVLAIIEVKGTKKGVKREYVNQVDSHRERNGLPSSTPGVLLINNEMSRRGIDRRFEASVPGDQVEHARKLNVLIIRSIDLLLLMRHLESSTARTRKLMDLLSSGGGWLKADPKRYRVVVK